MKKMMGFTIIQNELLDESQLTISARYLLMVLIRFSGQDVSCYPSQKTLGKILNLSTRQIRTHLNELIQAELISKKRSGFNRPNTYIVAKEYRKHTSAQPSNNEQPSSLQLGSAYPLHQGNQLPPKTTYRKETNKRGSHKGFELLREAMIERRLLLPNRVKTLKGK